MIPQAICGIVIFISQKRKRHRRIVAPLHIQSRPVDGSSVRAGGRSGLQTHQSRRQARAGCLAGTTARGLIRSNMQDAVQKGPYGQQPRTAPDAPCRPPNAPRQYAVHRVRPRPGGPTVATQPPRHDPEQSPGQRSSRHRSRSSRGEPPCSFRNGAVSRETKNKGDQIGSTAFPGAAILKRIIPGNGANKPWPSKPLSCPMAAHFKCGFRVICAIFRSARPNPMATSQG